MLRFNSSRTKDPVLAVIISMGLIFSAPVLARANTGSSYGEWEEVGPAGRSAQQQLLTAPPKVSAALPGQSDFRPPVEPPIDMSGVKTLAAANQDNYVVQSGDTLPKIAMKVYGDPNRWQDLMVINDIENGNRIFVGQKLIISSKDSSVVNHELPALSRVEREPTQISSVADFDNNEYEYEEVSVSADAVDANASYYGQTGGTYTVQRGDTLGAISKRILGSSQRWREISDANPGLNPNRLNVGQTIVIPGAQPSQQGMTPPAVTPVISRPLAAPRENRRAVITSQPNFSTPSYEAPPLMAPPPAIHSSAVQQQSNSGVFAPPPAPPMYSSGMQPPPPSPGVSAPSLGAPPPAATGGFAPPPPPPPPSYMGSPSEAPSSASSPGMPVAVSTRELYREERYRIPDELKPTNFSPYFANFNGYHGLFEVESALLPYLSTWHFGLHYRYEKYQYLNGEKNIIEGVEHIIPLHLAYAGKKLFAGVTVPFQNWEVSRSGGGNDVTLSGLHDPSIKVGYQLWKNLEGTHAVTISTEGKFASDNHHQPLADMSGKSRVGSRVGPAGATRGSWGQIGAAYSGITNDRWASHINLALANNSTDSITKMIIRGGMDYRVNNHFSIASEINSTSYDMDNGQSGTNVDMMLGFILFNDGWQGSVAFDMGLQRDWGYTHDFGVVLGLNHRWD